MHVEFGAHMHVSVENDGPVNIIIDTERSESDGVPMTRFLTLFDTVVTDPLEDIPTVNELEKWLKNVGEQAFYFFIRLAAAGLLLFIGSKLIKFLMNRFKRSKLYQKMDPGLASFMASGSRIVLYIILILMCFGVLGIETASFLALFTSGGVAIGLAFQGAVTNLAGGVMIFAFSPVPRVRLH